jgi:hypothetical protein
MRRELMRVLLASVFVIGCLLAADRPAQAQVSCKTCADQQKACMKNYAGPACATEYKICIKGCKK